MKLLLLILFISSAPFIQAELTEELLQKLATRRKECIAETGVDPKIVSDASTGRVAEDPKFNEHLFCMFKKTGFIDDAGNLQKDVIEKKLVGVINDKELAKKLIAGCSITKETPQLTSLANYKCYFEKTGLPII